MKNALLTAPLLVAACSSAPASAPSSLLGKSVSLALPTDSGMLAQIPSAGARATVLDFWAPTCVPCRKKLPELMARKGDIEARGGKLVLVGVLEAEESTESARDTLRSWGINAPFLIDRGGASRSQADVTTLPATLILDARGTLRWVAPKEASAQDIVNALP